MSQAFANYGKNYRLIEFYPLTLGDTESEVDREASRGV